MSTSKRQKSRGKETRKAEPSADFPGADGANPDLMPERLFAVNRYPPDCRINSYSKPEYLLDLVEALEGSSEYNYLVHSCFKSLFEIPVRKASLSGKLVHQMLCRCVHSEKKHELWFTFAGKPFRFSLREFGVVTGLPCGPYPSKATIKEMETLKDPKNPYWHELFGKDKGMPLIRDIVIWLKKDKRLPEEERMSKGRRLRLALIVIVEGILLCSSGVVRASKEIAEMVKDVEKFELYPWGRKSFELTMELIKVGKKIVDVEGLVKKLNQGHISTHGFTLALQLFILKSVPQLERYLPDTDDEATFTDRSIVNLSLLRTFHNANIMEVEEIPNLIIAPYLHAPDSEYNDVNNWADEVEDPSIDYLERLIGSGYKFTKDVWIGGNSQWDVILPESKHVKKEKARNVTNEVGKDEVQKRDKGKGKTCDENVEKEGQRWEGVDDEGLMAMFEAKLEEHMKKQKEVFAVEKKRMKEELYEELLRKLLEKLDVPVPKEKSKSVPETSKNLEEEVVNTSENGNLRGKEKVGRGEGVRNDYCVGEWEHYKGVVNVLESLERDGSDGEEQGEGGRKDEESKDGGGGVVKSVVDLEKVEKNKKVENVGSNEKEMVELGGNAVNASDSMETDVAKVAGKMGDNENGSSADFESDGWGNETDLGKGPNDDVDIVEKNIKSVKENLVDMESVRVLEPADIESEEDDTVDMDLQDAQIVKKGLDGRSRAEGTGMEETNVAEEDFEDRNEENIELTAEETRGKLEEVRTGVQSKWEVGVVASTLEEREIMDVKEGVQNVEDGHSEGDDEEIRSNMGEMYKHSSEESDMEKKDGKDLGNGVCVADQSIRGKGDKDMVEESGGQDDEGVDGKGEDNKEGEDLEAVMVKPIPRKRDIAPATAEDELPAKRRRCPPSRFCVAGTGKCPGMVDEGLRRKFMSKLRQSRKKEFIVNGHLVSKMFFIEVHSPKQVLDNNHIDAALAMLWRKNAEVLIQKRVAVLDTWFAKVLCTDYAQFKKMKKKEQWVWNSIVKNYVRGIVIGRANKVAWFDDVDVLYTPMNWGNGHWVAVVLDLKNSTISVLDPHENNVSESEMFGLMAPVAEMVPYVIAAHGHKMSAGTSPFVVRRAENVKYFDRLADLGPISIKLVEVHAGGGDVSSVERSMVEDIRMKYAMDIFEEFVETIVVG